MIGMLNRDQLTGAIAEEFEHLIAKLNSFLTQVFDADGRLLETPAAVQVPTGATFMWTTNTAPAGFLLCDGSQVNRLAYKRLFDVIGTTYGAGDGSLTFNLPDFRQRFPLGKAASGTGATLGATGGNIDHTHTITVDNAGDHDHTATTSEDGAHTHTQGAHQHAIGAGSASFATSDTGGAAPIYPATQVDIFSDAGTGSSGAHDHTLTTSEDGEHTHSATSGAANPPFLAVQFIIKD